MFSLVNLELTEEIERTIQGIKPKNTVAKKIYDRWKDTVNGLFSILVMDFDGTLRDVEDRKGPIGSKICEEICRISNIEGAQICIATGRKSSVYTTLNKLVDKGLQELKIIRGNGVEIISFPKREIIYSVEPFKQSDVNHIFCCLTKFCRLKKDYIYKSKKMVRIFLDNSDINDQRTKNILREVKKLFPNLNVSHSGYNIEIVPAAANKENAIFKLLSGKHKSEVLAIGDSGYRDGNDFGMLYEFPSFCVGTHSKRCLNWTLPVIDKDGNILKGPEATLYLLKNICQR